MTERRAASRALARRQDFTYQDRMIADIRRTAAEHNRIYADRERLPVGWPAAVAALATAVVLLAGSITLGNLLL
jgi:hypothetical protein